MADQIQTPVIAGEAQIIARHVFSTGLCVPKDWSPQQIEDWMNQKEHPTAHMGTCEWGFSKRGQVDPCELDSNKKHVYVEF